jgi:hypothetical protein
VATRNSDKSRNASDEALPEMRVSQRDEKMLRQCFRPAPQCGTAPPLLKGSTLTQHDAFDRRWRASSVVPERRRHFRYQLKLELEYCVLPKDGVPQRGRGLTDQISSTAVRFTCDNALIPGTSILLFIQWPSTQREQPLVLRTLGYVLRSDAREAVAVICKHRLGVVSEVGKAEDVRP